MEQSAHIFTPYDDSLQARVEAYQRVIRDFQRFTDNCQRLDANTLGESQDLDHAREVFVNSLQKAQQAVNSKDLQQAKSQGFITNDALVAMVQAQRSAELQAKRSTQQSTQHSHQQSR